MIDLGFIGKRLDPVEVRVPRERVAAFARAIGEDRAVHVDVDSAKAVGCPDLVLPPTMLFGLELEARGEGLLIEMGLDPLRVLHAEQSFTYHRNAHAGEVLRFEGVVADVYRRMGGRLEFVVQDSVVHRGDQHVADLRQVLVIEEPEKA
ncbi:MaoC family dehydratase N-terminal domain-containing protein [Saccharothrix longispora]|uniref:FAS1-like dehydratase domain-containing protein n=1 Tax=Saccharothrix longispora TaxID=33920 RepID=UPI0028FD146C|nr:MaoC family dehydratase N-terminal domain-containing protein [Saccharothrix longispora]MDU0291156.1 MaoC family dehydratase N-terminal domain-containing protein [Saccharothrix longispora]